MFLKPFAPFRVRPVRETIVRRSPLQPADILDALDAMPPQAVKAVRRPVKASPVLGAARRLDREAE
ncbi:MAG: hypothetical protein C0519_16505 [Hyphomicrobium sp.]|nr:hypothetical protein [Hyphomicrobium sp.]PPD07641.1 MAG: hypothetical protein CTY28_09220 [Hyphomicrobium sp.]